MSNGKILIQQLRLFLPLFTEIFSDTIAISSMTRSGSTVTVTTTTAHGLATGNFTTITGSKNPIDITSLTRVGKIATAITATDHDLTEDFIVAIQITGAVEANFNGNFKLKTVPNRKEFTFEIADSGATTATGSPELLENHRLGFNGRFAVTSTGSTTFTVTNATSGLGTTADTTSASIRVGVRISGDASIERIVQNYTKRPPDKVTGFIVLNDGVFNKDRRMDNDTTNARTLNDNFQVRLINEFTFYVFVPTRDSVSGQPSISGRGARDLMEDLKVPLYRSLLRFLIPSPFISCPFSVVTPKGHGFFDYNTAYYVHAFEFEFVEDLVANKVAGVTESGEITNPFLPGGGDTLPVIGNVAFRDINLKIENDDEEIIKDDFIDLDEDPLP